jgi:hypothetical protein
VDLFSTLDLAESKVLDKTNNENDDLTTKGTKNTKNLFMHTKQAFVFFPQGTQSVCLGGEQSEFIDCS